MAFWGNTYLMSLTEAIDLDQPEKKISIRFKVKKGSTLHHIRLYISKLTGSPADYILELQSDKGGYPSGTVLESIAFAADNPGWHMIEAFDYVLTAETIYHLVVYSPDADAENFLTFSYAVLTNNNQRFNNNKGTNRGRAVLINMGKGWKEISHADPIFTLDMADGTFLAQPYSSTFVTEKICASPEGVGQVVLMKAPRTITDISFLVRKSGREVPKGDLLFKLEDLASGEVVREGVLVPADKATTSFRWYTYAFPSPWTLKINAKYRLSLAAPDADLGCYYEAQGIETINELPYRDLRWGGKGSHYVYYDSETGSWRDRPYQDLVFRATVAPAHVLVKPTVPAAAGRRSKIILLIILLLLLLQASVVTYFYLTGRTRKVQSFVRRNKECLICHREMLAKLRLKDVHDPFIKRRCVDCHIDHAYSERKERRVITSETRVKRLSRDYCGKMLGISPESRCGKILGITKEKTTKGVLLESKYLKKYVPIAKPGLKMPQKQLCLTCHENLLEQTHRTYQHRPFDKGTCTSCHDPHASNYINLMVMSDYDLCFSCHGDLYPDLKKSVQHNPFELHHCVDCHHPHASNVAGILQDTQKNLCFSCHRTTAQQANLAVQHNPFEVGTCTSCHEPHSGEVARLLVEALPSLCYTCHPTIRTDFLRVSHHPLGVPQLKDCLNCHGPHATEFPKLCIAKDNLLCYKCHGSKQPYYDSSAHNRAVRVGVGVCLNCHSPHGTDWYSLVIKPESELCLICHDPYGYSRYYTDRTHPDGGISPRLLRTVNDRPGTEWLVCGSRVPTSGWLGKPFIDERTGREMRCSETCHDPHGTSNKHMLVWVPDSLCLLCHQPLELP